MCVCVLLCARLFVDVRLLCAVFWGVWMCLFDSVFCVFLCGCVFLRLLVCVFVCLVVCFCLVVCLFVFVCFRVFVSVRLWLIGCGSDCVVVACVRRFVCLHVVL